MSASAATRLRAIRERLRRYGRPGRLGMWVHRKDIAAVRQLLGLR